MKNITQDDLQRAINYLNNITGRDNDFGVEYSYGGCRMTKKNDSINISDRGTKRETYTFIRAYTDGVVEGMADVIVKQVNA